MDAILSKKPAVTCLGELGFPTAMRADFFDPLQQLSEPGAGASHWHPHYPGGGGYYGNRAAPAYAEYSASDCRGILGSNSTTGTYSTYIDPFHGGRTITPQECFALAGTPCGRGPHYCCSGPPQRDPPCGCFKTSTEFTYGQARSRVSWHATARSAAVGRAGNGSLVQAPRA